MKIEYIEENMQQVNERLQAACVRSGRNPEDVQMIAVTKYVSLPVTRLVLEAGLDHIGESRWQDVREKWGALGDKGTWHFIGHLQSNKAKDIVGKFAYIHSLDRFSLAQEIEKKAAELNITMKCFIQVNVSGEDSKHGLPPDKLSDFMKQLQRFSHIRIMGLMTMAPHEAEPEATRPVFRKLRELRDEINQSGLLAYKLDDLSMGMSNDFEIAIEEGATWIRLGSVLVGKSL